VLELGTAFLADIHKNFSSAVFVSDGYLGMSGAAELYLNHVARSTAPVRITGNWGGELLRGVRAFKHIPPQGDFLSRELVHELSESAKDFAEKSTATPRSFTLFFQAPSQGYGRYAIERSQVIMRSPFLDNELVEWLYRMPTSAHDGREYSEAVIAHERPDLLSVPTDQGRLGDDGTVARHARRLARQILAKAEYWTSHGAAHGVGRLISSPLGAPLERAFRGRNKFQHFRAWFRRELSDFLREMLLRREGSAELPSWCDVGRVAFMVNAHLAGRRNFTDELDRLLTLTLASENLLHMRLEAPDRALQAVEV
jgi:asparagine synthase (glutamine-hydrolysing)